jgi:hypothetical protein
VTRTRSGAIAGGLAATALLLGACGDAENTYVEEQGSGLFMRLPEDWEVFPVEDANPAGNPRIDADFGPWSVLIDGAERPNRAHGEEANPDEPVGTVQVVPLALFQSPPPLAHATLRGFFMVDGSDPLESDVVTDLEYDEVDLGHHWGNRLIGTVDQGGGEVRVAQLAFFDSGGKRIHVVRILCTVECFDDNEEEIEDVLDSFTLEDR